ncbi:hypothetical protein V8E36_001166 [Tilletia maclaganii]
MDLAGPASMQAPPADALDEMNAMWAEEDRVCENLQQAQARNGAFVDDAGDIAARLIEMRKEERSEGTGRTKQSEVIRRRVKGRSKIVCISVGGESLGPESGRCLQCSRQRRRNEILRTMLERLSIGPGRRKCEGIPETGGEAAA